VDDDLIAIISVLLLVGVAPLLIIMHYVTKWKSTKGLSDEEQQMLEDLWESSERMQSRLNTLETILDEKSKTWRDEN
jgi:phage shock protein B